MKLTHPHKKGSSRLESVATAGSQGLFSHRGRPPPRIRSPVFVGQVGPFAATLTMKKFTQKCLPWPCDVHTCHTQHLQMHLSNIFHSRMLKIRPPFRFARLSPLPLICGGATRSALAPDENRFAKRRRAPHSLRGKRCRAARFPRGAGRPRSQLFRSAIAILRWRGATRFALAPNENRLKRGAVLRTHPVESGVALRASPAAQEGRVHSAFQALFSPTAGRRTAGGGSVHFSSIDELLQL